VSFARLRIHKQDVSASCVVFLVALPLCMGIAIASGMPPSAGLITGIIGGIVVGTITGSPLQVSGPAAGLSVVVWNLVQQHGIEMVGLMVLMGGILQTIAGALHLGRFFRAISPAVVYGMLAGIGILICASQIHVMVDSAPLSSGLANLAAIPSAIARGLTFDYDTPYSVAFGLGMLTIATTLAWTRFRPEPVRFVPAPLVGVLVAVAAAALTSAEVSYVSIPDSLWSAVSLPTLSRLGEAFGYPLLAAGFSLAAIASAETLLCAAAVDRMQDDVRTDYDRELFAQGIGNSLCGLLGGLPMTGVIVRSSANVDAGAKTRASAILHGIWILALVALAPGVLRLVPTASLAGILLYTGYKLVNPAHVRELSRYGWGSVAIYAATLVGVVVQDLLSGVLFGLALSLLRLLLQLGSFRIDAYPGGNGARIDVHLRGAVTFVGLPRFAAALERLPSAREVQLHIDELRYIDHACIVAVGDYQRQQSKRGVHVSIDWARLDARSERAPALTTLQPSAESV